MAPNEFTYAGGVNKTFFFQFISKAKYLKEKKPDIRKFKPLNNRGIKQPTSKFN